MKKNYNTNYFALIFTIILAFSGFSCSDSYDEMFYELNGNFIEVGAVKLTPKIGDKDFNEEIMLPNFQYTINRNSSLCLTAPDGAEYYDWKIELPSETSNSRTLINRSVSNSNTLFYQPTDVIKLGVRYELTLIATTKEGTVYTDVAELIFYE